MRISPSGKPPRDCSPDEERRIPAEGSGGGKRYDDDDNNNGRDAEGRVPARSLSLHGVRLSAALNSRLARAPTLELEIKRQGLENCRQQKYLTFRQALSCRGESRGGHVSQASHGRQGCQCKQLSGTQKLFIQRVITQINIIASDTRARLKIQNRPE